MARLVACGFDLMKAEVKVMNNSSKRDLDAIACGIVRAFRISASISLGFVASLFVVTFSVMDIPVPLVLALSTGFAATLLWRAVIRMLGKRTPRTVEIIVSIAFFAAFAYAFWCDSLGIKKEPMEQPHYAAIVFTLMVGRLLADKVLGSDPKSPPFEELRSAWTALWNSLGTTIPVVEAIAFGCAVLVSLAINVPVLRPQIQAALAGGATLVTLSLGWYARFAPPVRNASAE